MHEEKLLVLHGPGSVAKNVAVFGGERPGQGFAISKRDSVRSKRRFRAVAGQPALPPVAVFRSRQEIQGASHCQLMVPRNNRRADAIAGQLRDHVESTGHIVAAIHEVADEHDPPPLQVTAALQLTQNSIQLVSLPVDVANHGDRSGNPGFKHGTSFRGDGLNNIRTPSETNPFAANLSPEWENGSSGNCRIAPARAETRARWAMRGPLSCS